MQTNRKKCKQTEIVGRIQITKRKKILLKEGIKSSSTFEDNAQKKTKKDRQAMLYSYCNSIEQNYF